MTFKVRQTWPWRKEEPVMMFEEDNEMREESLRTGTFQDL